MLSDFIESIKQGVKKYWMVALCLWMVHIILEGILVNAGWTYAVKPLAQAAVQALG